MSYKREVTNLRHVSAGAFANPSSAIKLLAAIIAPAILLYASVRGGGGLPWYLLGLAVIGFLVVLLVGFLMFTRPNREAEISISPINRTASTH